MTTTDRTTVYIADDHPVFREAIARAIQSQPEFELVGAAGDGREALEAVRELAPAVAILDHRLPSLEGVEILRTIRRESRPTRVIILSGEDAGSIVYDALELGAAGFLTKAATMAAICTAVTTVAAGGTVLAPEVQQGLAAELRTRSLAARPSLSPREAQVLGLIAEGRSAPEIGTRLFISASTVKTHIKALFEKLEVNDRAAAVAEGMRRGLVR